jgi:hypothetical protein
MSITRSYTFMAAVLVACTGVPHWSAYAQTPGTPPLTSPSTEPWQRSWEAYIDAYNKCLGLTACKPAARFGGKRVTWEGTFERLNLEGRPPTAVFAMASPRGFDVSTPPAMFKVIAPEIREGSLERWKKLPNGNVIRFSATIEPGGGILAVFGMVGSRFLDADLVDVR